MRTFPSSGAIKLAKSTISSWFPETVGGDEYDRAVALVNLMSGISKKMADLIKDVGDLIRSENKRPSDLSLVHDYNQIVMRTELKVLIEVSRITEASSAKVFNMTVEEARSIIVKRDLAPES